jgi:uncharacterized integral membrane protein (TIGR00697 family)
MATDVSIPEEPPIFSDAGSLLFVVIGGFFIANAVAAEFIGTKVFSLNKMLGIDGISGLFMSAGAILWPLEFAIGDIINEYYGKRGVRLLSLLAAGLISYVFLMVALAIWLPPAETWIFRKTESGVVNMDIAFNTVFSQGALIIVGSLIAFLAGQILDVVLFQKIKSYTGERALWLRATGSTLISQLVDSYIVLFIAFYFTTDWDVAAIFKMGMVKYGYKFAMAILLTPLIYLMHAAMDRYLGAELAEALKKSSMVE